jgi:hypothetical protein
MSYGPSDVIQFKEISTGGNEAGNGGDGYNKGNLDNKQYADFSPTNKAYGSHVDVTTGDKVHQKADWDAGDANGGKAKVLIDGLSKGYDSAYGKANANGGQSSSNGSQNSDSGHNQSKVSADTTAYQTNYAKIDQSAHLIAGNGGDGGNGNSAKGGDVSFALVHYNPETDLKYLEVKEVPKYVDHYPADVAH